LPEGWLSAEKKVFARRANGSAQFIDLGEQETYDFMPTTKVLNRFRTSDSDNIDAGHFETLLRLVAEGDRAIGLPESLIQVVRRPRRDVRRGDGDRGGDRRWTEFTFACRDSRRIPADYQVTFRVDPDTRLPVEMRSTEKFSA